MNDDRNYENKTTGRAVNKESRLLMCIFIYYRT